MLKNPPKKHLEADHSRFDLKHLEARNHSRCSHESDKFIHFFVRLFFSFFFVLSLLLKVIIFCVLNAISFFHVILCNRLLFSTYSSSLFFLFKIPFKTL